MSSPYILEMHQISKTFPGVKALDEVELKVFPGEVHALVGENGAGKSTLIKVLSGVYPAGTYEGKIFISGKLCRFHNIQEAEAAGIAVIHQELTLIRELTVGENIFLGNEPLKRGMIDWDRLYCESRKLLSRVRLDLGAWRKIKELGLGQQQLVEIAKALSKQARILILDEPTAALTEGETHNLMVILKELRAEGVTCIYISHRLGEVFEIADRVTVLRDGCTVGSAPVGELNESKIIAMMVGRELTDLYPREHHQPGSILLEVEDLTVVDPTRPDHRILNRISFQVRAGEILGIAGLMGSGRTELVMSLFGAYPGKVNGTVRLNGKPIRIRSPFHGIQNGLGLVTEDRKRYGLVLKMNVMENLTMAGLRQVSGVFINPNEELKAANGFVGELRIKTPSLETQVNHLSGGNQQKVVVGKWLLTNPKILFLDEPTRGIDVGAKVELYRIMNDLVRQGVGVVMISSELPEILGMSDRILVMCQGRIAGELSGTTATQEQVMYFATGGR